ncbi:MAG: VWA domain-containing protein [Acidobacteria bacterium]|nr:VWA domain-containing protein [Acidobacteriota bacterium]
MTKGPSTPNEGQSAGSGARIAGRGTPDRRERSIAERRRQPGCAGAALRGRRGPAARPCPILLVACALAALAAAVHGQTPAQQAGDQDPFRFRSGVDLVSVTATVSDLAGHFVSNLAKDDFVVYEDDRPVEVTSFSADRVPVSLGIAVDTSGSMAGEKMQAARGALERFLTMLLDRGDEMFLYRFSETPELVQPWSDDRDALARALGRLHPSGGTAMYDAVAEAVPMVGGGRNRKKALLIVSDGRDTSSVSSVMAVKGLIRESEALVYAVGVDCSAGAGRPRAPIVRPQRLPGPRPFPLPPGGRPPWGRPQPPPRMPDPGWMRPCSDPVDAEALRDLTDDSGGRTEIVRDARDLAPATEGIADELTRQYSLGYPAPARKDGRWHTIRVEVRNPGYRVRARRGYFAN